MIAKNFSIEISTITCIPMVVLQVDENIAISKNAELHEIWLDYKNLKIRIENHENNKLPVLVEKQALVALEKVIAQFPTIQ